MTTKKIFCAVLLLAVILFAGNLSAGNFTITNFHSDILINEDGSFVVSETIEVEFHQKKHGIYREIPFKYNDGFGKTVYIPIDVISVTDENGNRHTSKVSKKGNVVNIRIGDADRYVYGKMVYVIKYKTTNGILYFDDYDELYWNVTGNYWDADIEQASATVILTTDKKSEYKDYACYTGRYGSNKSDCSYEPLENGARFYSHTSLQPNEGFTIAFAFDKGIVAEPSEFSKFMTGLNLKENWVFILPVISFFFMFFHWRKKGRDPEVRMAITVKYNPPKVDGRELTAAEVGTLIDETLDSRDISAGIIGLAVKGYLKIAAVKRTVLFFTQNDYKMTALKTDYSELTEFERWLMNGIFEGGKKQVEANELKNKFYKHLPKLSKSIFKQLVDHGFFLTSPNTTAGKYAGYGIVVLIFVGLIQLMFVSLTLQPVLVTILTALPFFLFAKAMPAKTRKGAVAYSDILGFQEFLERAEKDKLERMQDKDLFSKYLPYAISMNVVDNWARAFEGIDQNAPTWYVGTHGLAHFQPVEFAHSINATTSHLSQVAFSAPRSSGTGGGGGGFSGGGGGGGGGGSW